MGKNLAVIGAYVRCGLLAALVLVCSQAGVFAQTSGSFTVDTVLDSVDLQGNAETAATSLATAIAGLIVIIFAFRLLRRAWGWARKAV